MDLSQEHVAKIAAAISSRLGPNASADEIRKAAAAIVTGLRKDIPAGQPAESKTPPENLNAVSHHIGKSLILSALGPENNLLEEKLRAFINGRALHLVDISNIKLGKLQSLVALVDNSDYRADLTQLKFDLDGICRQLGFHAIVQDSSYFNIET